MVYLITDVKDLYDWVRACFGGKPYQRGTGGGGDDDNDDDNDGGGRDNNDDNSNSNPKNNLSPPLPSGQLWQEISPSDLELEHDPCIRAIRDETEEGRKVARNGGDKFVACWRRGPDPDWPV